MKIIYFLFCFTFIISGTNLVSNAASPIDSAKLKCTYEFLYLNDSIENTYSSSELYIVQIGKDHVKSYFYKTFYRDSMESTPAGINELTNMVNTFVKEPANYGKYPPFLSRGDFPVHIYKDYKKEKIITTDWISSHRFTYEEKLVPQDWTIIGDTMTILGYSCQKAQCSFRGREWEAWFAADIPVSEGPWKFSGLPGLILMLKDTQSHYSFELKGLQQVNEPIFMDISKKATKIDRISFLKLLMGAKGNEIVAMDLAKVGITPNTSTGKKYDYIELDYK
ncbi:MAG: GLPGLI family protein [Dysgonamonadaceae bacterium]|jgi:GLPGLI family protein|nr:GLPGLI family protein [Dysgonamonadaceae bacterium]